MRRQHGRPQDYLRLHVLQETFHLQQAETCQSFDQRLPKKEGCRKTHAHVRGHTPAMLRVHERTELPPERERRHAAPHLLSRDHPIFCDDQQLEKCTTHR